MIFVSRSSPKSHRRCQWHKFPSNFPLFSIVRASLADSILFIMPANTNFPLFKSFVSNYRLRVHDSDAAEKKKAIFESEINHCNLNHFWLDGWLAQIPHSRASREQRKKINVNVLRRLCKMHGNSINKRTRRAERKKRANDRGKAEVRFACMQRICGRSKGNA